MLMTLLRNQGRSSSESIAKEFLIRDHSQIDYYSQITKNMPARVLHSHNIIDKLGSEYTLKGYDDFSPAQIDELVEACQNRLDDYLEKRGKSTFDHRKKSSGYVSGTLRYEILKTAKFRCELCGISAEQKALEVDHIIPRNKGGSDDISNLQSLCYSCNAMKRDRDDTDFRGISDSYNQREKGCLFCEISKQRVVGENELAYMVEDSYPVTSKHSLIIPKRHAPSYFDLGRPEVNACNDLLEEMKTKIMEADSAVTGFNVGINIGEDAGQSIFHCHIHLIPRRKGDSENPRGGVRGVIAGKQNY
jgi:diadenosine tetraphosphate (Ap4A) HIT family hydrolase/5-methylcytosine-specific restriction endonuclease McrA